MDVEALNEYLLQYLMDDFMRDFLADAKRGIIHSAERASANMEEAVRALRESAACFEKSPLDHAEAYRVQKHLTEKVEAAIDRLALVKDSLSYTFGSSIRSELDRYFGSIGKNAKAERKHARDQRRVVFRAINARLPHAQQIEIRPIEHQNFHRCTAPSRRAATTAAATSSTLP